MKVFWVKRLNVNVINRGRKSNVLPAVFLQRLNVAVAHDWSVRGRRILIWGMFHSRVSNGLMEAGAASQQQDLDDDESLTPKSLI